MPRYFIKRKQELVYIQSIINTLLLDIEKYIYGDGDSKIMDDENSKIMNDLKCKFDWENFESQKGSFGPQGLMGINTLDNGFNFWGMCAGGDWEEPVFFIFYYDGKEIRGYVPTAGNPWNTKTKEAYGNDEEKDIENKKKRKDLPKNSKYFDEDLIIQDIKNRIVERK